MKLISANYLIRLLNRALVFGFVQFTVMLDSPVLYAQDASGLTIGLYEWSNNNLDVTHFRNGEPIPEARSDEEWRNAAENGTPAWCYYENDPSNARKYGVLYNWYAVNDPRGLAPAGWDIPARRELRSLMTEVGVSGSTKLKSKDGWVENSKNTDILGFRAFPAGVRYIGGHFHNRGNYTYYWTATSKGKEHALYFDLAAKRDNIDSTAIFSYLKKGAGMSVRCVRRTTYGDIKISPEDTPNDGIMFVDHETDNRSGHYGSALTTCQNGDVLSFYTNVSGKIYAGHGIAGWSEYRRSKDGGITWGDPVALAYSKQVWDSNKISGDTLADGQNYMAARVTAVVTAANGTIVAFLSRQLANNRDNYLGFKTPIYMLSYDDGISWTEPREVDETVTSNIISLTNQDGATFVYDGVVYAAFIGGYGTGKYSFYASTDNGETFNKVSDGLFKNRTHKTNYFYTAAKALDDGRFIVYGYNMDDEFNLPYVISEDQGRTWSEVKTTYMQKRVRALEISDKVGGYYFMVGRSGSFGVDPLNLVLYVSKNGIDWDSGRYLNKVQLTLDAYSAIEAIKTPHADNTFKVLVQSTLGYGVAANVNIKHWWIEVNRD